MSKPMMPLTQDFLHGLEGALREEDGPGTIVMEYISQIRGDLPIDKDAIPGFLAEYEQDSWPKRYVAAAKIVCEGIVDMNDSYWRAIMGEPSVTV